MIIVLNGYPGVGKLTIGGELAALVDGRLLDIHSVYNIAFALTEFKSPQFMEAVEDVEAIAHKLILRLPDNVPVVLTTVIAGDSDWGRAEWKRIVKLGDARPPFLVVHVHCGLDENIRRIQSPQRSAKRKPRDPGMASATSWRARCSPALRHRICWSLIRHPRARLRRRRSLQLGPLHCDNRLSLDHLIDLVP